MVAERDGGTLSGAKAAKLELAQRSIAEAEEERAGLAHERDSCAEEGRAAEEGAALAEAAVAAMRESLEEAEARRAALTTKLTEVVQRQPRRPSHMLSVEEEEQYMA